MLDDQIQLEPQAPDMPGLEDAAISEKIAIKPVHADTTETAAQRNLEPAPAKSNGGPTPDDQLRTVRAELKAKGPDAKPELNPTLDFSKMLTPEAYSAMQDLMYQFLDANEGVRMEAINRMRDILMNRDNHRDSTQPIRVDQIQAWLASLKTAGRVRDDRDMWPHSFDTKEKFEFFKKMMKAMQRIRRQADAADLTKISPTKYLVESTLDSGYMLRKISFKLLEQAYRLRLTAWSRRAHGGTEYHPRHIYRDRAEAPKLELDDPLLGTEAAAHPQTWKIKDEARVDEETGQEYKNHVQLAALLHGIVKTKIEWLCEMPEGTVPREDLQLRVKLMIDGGVEKNIFIKTVTTDTIAAIKALPDSAQGYAISNYTQAAVLDALYPSSGKNIDKYTYLPDLNQRAVIRAQSYSNAREDVGKKDSHQAYRSFFQLDNKSGSPTNDHYDYIIDFHTKESPLRDQPHHPASLFLADGSEGAFHFNGETGAVTFKPPHFESDGKHAFRRCGKVAQYAGQEMANYKQEFRKLLRPDRQPVITEDNTVPRSAEMAASLREQLSKERYIPQEVIVSNAFERAIPKVVIQLSPDKEDKIEISPTQMLGYAVGRDVPYLHFLYDASKARKVDPDPRHDNLQPVIAITQHLTKLGLDANSIIGILRDLGEEVDDARYGNCSAWLLQAPLGEAAGFFEPITHKLDRQTHVLLKAYGLFSPIPDLVVDKDKELKAILQVAEPVRFVSARAKVYEPEVNLRSREAKDGINGIGSIGYYWNPELGKHVLSGRFKYSDFQGMYREMAMAFNTDQDRSQDRNIDAMDTLLKQLAAFSLGKVTHQEVNKTALEVFKNFKFKLGDGAYEPHHPELKEKFEERQKAGKPPIEDPIELIDEITYRLQKQAEETISTKRIVENLEANIAALSRHASSRDDYLDNPTKEAHNGRTPSTQRAGKHVITLQIPPQDKKQGFWGRLLGR